VLPFDDDSGDSKQAYLGDGIAESLTTNLSKFAALFVIAPASAAKYRGTDRDVRQVGSELGVRYIVRGRVNRDPGQVRISAQLVDAENRRQIWAEHYDHALTSIFTIQDEVARSIVVTLIAHISKTELDRVLLKRPESWTAYDYYLRGNSILRTANRQDRIAVASAAMKLYEQALAADPHFAPAVQGLAQAYVMKWQNSTRYDPATHGFDRQELLERALELARHAVDLDGNLAEARATLAFVLRWKDRPAEAVAEYERASALNPNLADGRLAEILIQQGRAPEAIALMKRIMRLDPHHSPQYFQALGNAYYLVGEYRTAAEQLRTAALRIPDCLPAYVWLAAAEARSGRDAEARRAAAQATRLIPTFTITRWLTLLQFAKQEDAADLAEGLRKAGLPD
jgi:adenylate cyclase